MPWHIRNIAHKCKVCGCRADYELYNRMNAPSGYYCKKHGEQAAALGETAETINERRSVLFRRKQ